MPSLRSPDFGETTNNEDTGMSYDKGGACGEVDSDSDDAF
jgi:hypothetical protein